MHPWYFLTLPPLKVLRVYCCVFRKPFLLFWFLCLFAWKDPKISLLFVCLFVFLNRWSSFPPQINLNHFARRQNRISQRTKQVFQGTLQHGQTVFLFFLKKPNIDDTNMTRICFKKRHGSTVDYWLRKTCWFSEHIMIKVSPVQLHRNWEAVSEVCMGPKTIAMCHLICWSG